MRTRTQLAKKNVIYGIVGRIIVIILEFIGRFFFIRFLGSELLGVSGVFTNILQCLSLAEMGITNVVMFSYYEPLANNDQKKLSALNNFYKKVFICIALCVTFIGLLLIPFLSFFIQTNNDIPHLSLIYLLFLADTVTSYLCIYKITILTADQNAYIVTKYDIINNIVRTVIQVLSLILYKNYIVYLSIKIAFSIFGNLIKSKRADKEYLFTSQESKLTSGEKKKVIDVIKAGFIYKLSTILLNSTDNILISSMVGTIWVGYLSNYVTICTAVASFVTIAFNNITASVGNLVTTEENEKKRQIFNVMTMTSSWIAFVCFSCTFILCDDFITLWIGEEYVMDFSIVLPKIMMLYISCIMQPIFSFREALGLYTKTKYIMLLSAILNIVLSIWLGIMWGVSGILIASLIAVLITYFWYEPYLLCKDYFGGTALPYYKRVVINMLICGISTSVLYGVASKIYSSNWIVWIIKAIVTFLVINVECMALYGKSEEFRFLVCKILIRNKEM